MPKFFFNVHDGKSVPDAVGTEFATAEKARAAGVAMAGEILRDAARDVRGGERFIVTVTDDRGVPQFSIKVQVGDEQAAD